MDLTQKIVMAAIAILLGAILTGVIATQTYENTSKDSVVNETIDISSARNSTGQLNTSKVFYPTYYATGWRAESDQTVCQPGYSGNGFILLNSSGSTMTDTTNYELNDDGSFTLYSVSPLNGTGTSNTTYVSYNYCPEGYLSQSWSRSTFNMIAGFMALLVLIICIYYFYSIYKEVK